jgi:type IV pilus assembly protein PilM
LSIIERLQHWISNPPPAFVFEMTEASLTAAAPKNPSQQKYELLAERGLAVSPSTPNLTKPYLYREALRRMFPDAGVRHPASALVIPDYAVRMALLDFEEFPQREEDRMALLRFRLRKSVPFHIDEAQLSYAIQTQEDKQIEVLAVAIARPILQEYEAVFVDEGYRVGVVLPSSLAALRLCAASPNTGLTLLVKAAGASVSILLLDGTRVRLIRCLDLTGAETDEDQPEADVLLPLLEQTAAYTEDQLGEPIKRLLLCGFGPETETLAKVLGRELSIPCGPVQSRFGAASQGNTGLLGLLERYAA